MWMLFGLIVGFLAGFITCWLYKDRVKAKIDA